MYIDVQNGSREEKNYSKTVNYMKNTIKRPILLRRKIHLNKII